jgi:hypothetical protein
MNIKKGDGYDPTQGRHADSREESPAFVCNIIEPKRLKVNCNIWEFVTLAQTCLANYL